MCVPIYSGELMLSTCHWELAGTHTGRPAEEKNDIFLTQLSDTSYQNIVTEMLLYIAGNIFLVFNL